MSGKLSGSCLDNPTITDLAELNEQISATTSRSRKRDLIAAALSCVSPDQRSLMVSYLCGELPQGRIGIGPATLRELELPQPEPGGGLTLPRADRYFEQIKLIGGKGAKQRRAGTLATVLAETTRPGQLFLLRLLSGGLRQGALLGVVEAAVAAAAGVSAAALRRAVTLSGSLVEAARVAFSLGEPGLLEIQMSLLRPLAPMLASPAPSMEEAVGRWGRSWWELKLDGARVQVHRQADQVKVFSRSLREVTSSLPEVVEAALTFPSEGFVLDGEVVAVDKAGRCLPFQETMRRFGRRGAPRSLRRELPLRVCFFDLLLNGGQELLDRPFEERRRRLEDLVGSYAVEGQMVESQEQAEKFLARAMQDGYEGLMAKNLDGCYEAGRRGAHWLKLKPYHTLDLVVIGAEWGSGRRRGWLSNLHLAAADPVSGDMIMLGKTFKGLSDKVLRWQTKRLLELEVERDEHTVYVRPELVVEIAFNELQSSPHYPGGLALRFARVKGYRGDKSAEQADTMDTVREFYRPDKLGQGERDGPFGEKDTV